MRLVIRLSARATCVALLALGLPATAGAVTALPTLSATAGSVKHYTVYFSASSFGSQLDFLRTAHGATQDHSLSNDGATGVAYTAAADLSSARIVSSWGSHGKVSMTFTATGRPRKLLPKGCTGRAALSRTGTLKGSLTAKLDKRFFKTFKRTRMTATLSEAGISETAPASALSIAADASSATGRGVSPFLSGALLFRAVGPHTSRSATGAASGSFTATFDSIGRQKIAHGSGGNVSQP
jgi:hypothetical protein